MSGVTRGFEVLTGPLVVVGRNRGGAYVLCELDGSVLDRPTAAFRLVPYLARTSIPLPENFSDITVDRMRALLDSTEQGNDDSLDDVEDLELDEAE